MKKLMTFKTEAVFNPWLILAMLILLSVTFMVMPGAQAAGENNLILNPDFETGAKTPWNFYSNVAGNTFTVTSPGAASSANSAKVSLSSAGSNIQLNQKDITIEPNKSYTLTFDAYSNTGHDLKVSLFKNVSPYTNYGLNQTVNLTTSWQNFSFEFTSPALGGTVNDARLMFWFVTYGVAGDVYRIDNVVLKAADEPPPPPPPPPEDNLILNPGFESGTNNWAFYSGGAANFTVTSPGAAGSANSAKVSLSSAGSNIQLNQKDITIESNTSYTLTFDAYSNTGHDLKVSLFKNVAPYTNYGLNQTVNLTTSWKTYSYEFTSPALGGTVNDARLMLWFAAHGAAGDIYRIDNVALKDADALPPPPPPPPPEDNLILNPGYESGTNNWAFFSGGAAQFTVTSPGAAGSANSAKVSLSSAGSNIQLNQKDITIESNTRYRLTFDAYSNTGHDLKVSLFKNVAPYTNYGLNQTVNLTSSWQNFSFEFTSPNLGGTVNDARLMLWVAAHGAAGDIYRIDNVVLIETDAINHAPVLVPIGNKSIDEGGNLVFGVSASDPDGDFVIITASGLETWMSLNGGTFYATPGFSDSGSYSVTFTATDGELTDTETVTIIVNNIPQPPPPPPPEDNLILNPSYESGTNNWAFFSGGAAQFTVTSPGAAGSANSAKVSLSSAGSNIQLNQKDIAIASNTSYTLTFDAYS
ncbi:MAG: carbohydrate binding domain-containing protein, partial [Candidatus Pacebacteria bacterium]|nr:carbohydrate binding domain-containing protein [Candidatus Paceibacterota bacterium]